MINGLALTLGLLTVGVHGGGLLNQEASLRRTLLPTAELVLSTRVLGPVDVSLGYGAASQREAFPGFEARTTYHRVPARVGVRVPLGRVALGAGAGAALLATRTSFDDGASEEGDISWRVGAVLGARGETVIFDPPAAGSLLGRLLLDVYIREQRTDVTMMVGLAWRLPGG